MMSVSSEKTTLGQCVDFVSGGTPSKNRPDFWNGSIPWVSAKDLKSWYLFDSQDKITDLGAVSGTRIVPTNSLLVLVRGMTLHRDIPICRTKVAVAINQDLKALIPKDGVDIGFIAYWLISKKRQLLGMVDSAGHGTGRLNTDELKAIEICLPPIDQQRRIASVFEAIDDKIELNRRMNATLEAMAKALFKSWFIDFDPVRAKLDLRQPPNLPPATAALFPDSYEESELGPIPKGWSAKPLPEVIEVNPRRSLKSGTVAPYLDMKNLPTKGHSADEVVDREFSSGTKFQNGDTLLARITPCLENGKTGYVDFLKDGEVGWGSTEYIVFAPKPPLTKQFGYLLARSDELRAHAIQNMTGTSGRQRVPADCFSSFLIAVPPQEIAQRFDDITGPSFERIKSNIGESRKLVAIRDTLLPALLAGAFSVFETTRATVKFK